MNSDSAPGERPDLDSLVGRLLVRDADVHREALAALADRGDERVIPHLIELLMIDAIGGDWERFGFPEVLRERAPPRYLELPEARWPGVADALDSLAPRSFDSEFAWVEWESWYSQQDIAPLEGFDEWKLQLYRSYLPPVGGLLDAAPRDFDLQDVRWGNCDRSFLAALNGPAFVPGDAVVDDDRAEDGDSHERYLKPDDHVFGFELDGTAYAVPRWVLFPHELLNATLAGVPVGLTYCTLCNAPILYDRRVGDETLTFGSSGLLLSGNKVMFDEQTESLWSQHRGEPLAGEFLDRDVRLDVLAVTQTSWSDWRESHPESLALDINTGYDFDYRHYDGDLGFFRHYWEDESVIQPGVERAESALPEKEPVYGVIGENPEKVHIYPVAAVREHGVLTDELDGLQIVVTLNEMDDVAVYEAPPLPVAFADGVLCDGEGNGWKLTGKALVPDGDSESERRERVSGRHGLWFAFRSQYDDPHVVTGE